MIAIASDHGGFKLKKIICDYLKEKNIEYTDLGTFNEERTDYPIYAKKLAENIIKGKSEKGILICKSGHGMNITANKFKDIYASLCYSKESVLKAVKDDNINVCVLSSEDINNDEVKDMIDIFLNEKLKDEDERYLDRFNMVKEIEDKNFKKVKKERIKTLTLLALLVYSIIVTTIFFMVIPKFKQYTFTGNLETEKEVSSKFLKKDDLKVLEKSIQELEKIINFNFLFQNNIKPENMVKGALKGYVAALGDQYTEYLTKEEAEKLLGDLDGKLVGIGVSMQKTERGIEIVEVFDESPAKKAGLRSEDIIEKVDGKSVKEMSLDEIVKRVTGEEGTKVNIEISRKGNIEKFEIIRKKINIRYISSRMIDEEIGYIKLNQFGEDAAKLFKEEYTKLEKSGMKKLIFDLRDNTGGELKNAEKIIDMFLPEDKVMYSTRDMRNLTLDVRAKRKEKKDIKIVILGNKFTASASELLTAALVDNKKAILVGEKTFGKGLIQEMKVLKNGDCLKMTIQEYLRPNGDTINKKGIKPDVEEKLDIEKYMKDKTDTQLNKAIEIIKKR